MTLKHQVLALTVALVQFSSTGAYAGTVTEFSGAIVCVTDKWDEKEREKGHKFADAASRCVLVPDDKSAPKVSETCSGKYEYMPDGTWKAAGTCTDHYKDGGKVDFTWEEGSHLKDYTYKYTGGTGKYQGVKGGGTYFYEAVTDSLFGGKYAGKMELP